MLRWFGRVAVVMGLAIAVSSAHGAGGGRGGATGGRHGGGPGGGNHNNSAQYLRAENGCFGPVWASGTTCWGYGAGCGYGWGYTPWVGDYWPERVPYFSVFPPVYYSYSEGRPVVSSSYRPVAWSPGDIGAAAVEPAVAASPARPLRIVNPYCQDVKADRP
jgi:hypothetical protein